MAETLVKLDAIVSMVQVKDVDDRIFGGHEIDGHFLRRKGFDLRKG